MSFEDIIKMINDNAPALAAFIVSLGSMYYAGEQAQLTRNHNKLSVRPRMTQGCDIRQDSPIS